MLVSFFFMMLSIAAASSPSAWSFLRSRHEGASDAAPKPTFMIISGITAPEEMCLTAEAGPPNVAGVDVLLQPCAAAIAAGDGRELFRYEDGHLMHIASHACVSLRSVGAPAGGQFILDRCGEATNVFEFTGSGQIKVADTNLCLTQHGLAAGTFNVALHAATTASSTADALTHGAGMSVDGRTTFWASRPEPHSSEELSVDFGHLANVQAAEITWEYPAKSFSIFLLEDGDHWTEVFSTDVNVLNATRVSLGHRLATKAKVMMYEPHPLYAQVNGRSIFGIQSLAFVASRLATVADECARADRSTDARDKYFLVAASTYDAYPSKASHSERPELNAAAASLAGVASALVAVLPELPGCRQKHVVMLGHPAVHPASAHKLALHINASEPAGEAPARQLLVSSHPRVGLAAGAESYVLRGDEELGVDLEVAALLLKETRAAVMQVRAALM